MTNVTDVPISDFIMTEFFQKKLDDYKKKIPKQLVIDWKGIGPATFTVNICS
jgi:hypothetical protein